MAANDKRGVVTRRRNERVRRQGANRSSAGNCAREIASTSPPIRWKVVRTRQEIDKMRASAVPERQAEVHFVCSLLIDRYTTLCR